MFGACANGDFGRVKPGIITPNIHAWIGKDAARSAGFSPSTFPLTDNERTLRDLAYPFIEPPYDRQRFYGVVNEYGASRVFRRHWGHFDVTAYHARLHPARARSQEALYARLDGDIRNDVERIPAFFDMARRVLDIDRKRALSLAHVTDLTEPEAYGARARNSENALVVTWVQRSLETRARAYQYALERLVIATPSVGALDGERSLTLLRARIAENLLVAAGPIAGLPPINESGPPAI